MGIANGRNGSKESVSPFWLTMADLAAGVVNAEALAAKARVAAAESFIIYFVGLGLGAKQRWRNNDDTMIHT